MQRMVEKDNKKARMSWKGQEGKLDTRRVSRFELETVICTPSKRRSKDQRSASRS